MLNLNKSKNKMGCGKSSPVDDPVNKDTKKPAEVKKEEQKITKTTTVTPKEEPVKKDLTKVKKLQTKSGDLGITAPPQEKHLNEKELQKQKQDEEKKKLEIIKNQETVSKKKQGQHAKDLKDFKRFDTPSKENEDKPYVAIDTKSGYLVIVKTLLNSKEKNAKADIDKWLTLNHENVLPFNGSFKKPDGQYSVSMEIPFLADL